MIPHCQQPVAMEHPPLCFTTASMDGSANDRATKRQRGAKHQPVDELTSSCSNHTASTCTSSTVYSGQSETPSYRGSSSKRVSFAPITAIHSSDWTRDEADAGWYSKDELAVFKQERKSLVKVLKRVQFDLSQVDTSVHCLRGYEAYFSVQANKEYKFKRQMVWKAVLQEQSRQRHQGRTDAMMMQLVSSHATQWARDTATELGMQDAQVALAIFLEYMREQQEDDELDELDEYNENDDNEGEEEDFDDAPIAVNWNEEEEDYLSGWNLPNGLELFAGSSIPEEDSQNNNSNNNSQPQGWNHHPPQQQPLTTLDNDDCRMNFPPSFNNNYQQL